MKLAKLSLALLLSASLMTSVASATGTDTGISQPTATPTNTPELTPTAASTNTPNPSATTGTTGTPNPTTTAKSTSTPKATATAKPTPTPTPKIIDKKPKAPKIKCTAGKGKIIFKYNTVKNAKGLEVRWYGKKGYKNSGRYNYVYGKEINGTFWVKKGKTDLPVREKGKYTIKVRAYSAGSKPNLRYSQQGSLNSKWVKATVTVKKLAPSNMNYNEG